MPALAQWKARERAHRSQDQGAQGSHRQDHRRRPAGGIRQRHSRSALRRRAPARDGRPQRGRAGGEADRIPCRHQCRRHHHRRHRAVGRRRERGGSPGGAGRAWRDLRLRAGAGRRARPARRRLRGSRQAAAQEHRAAGAGLPGADGPPRRLDPPPLRQAPFDQNFHEGGLRQPENLIPPSGVQPGSVWRTARRGAAGRRAAPHWRRSASAPRRSGGQCRPPGAWSPPFARQRSPAGTVRPAGPCPSWSSRSSISAAMHGKTILPTESPTA